MTPFAHLLETLAFTPGRNAKLAHLQHFFAQTPDPDRGWALAALAGTLDLPHVTSSVIRALVEERVDPVLFRLSYDYVGDLAETVALLWPGKGNGTPPTLDEVVGSLRMAGRTDRAAVLAQLLERLDGSGRYALIKLCTGGMRVGVSTRLVQTALAGPDHPLEDITEMWFGLEPPYLPLFAWLDGGARPDLDLSLAFRPVMLATPLDEARLADMVPAQFVAEWKWDGIRVQAVATPEGRRLYTRTGEDISAAFPDVIDRMDWHACLDGELLVRAGADVAPFADLQKRLNRKRVTAKMMAERPAMIRVYDILEEDGEDLRPLPLETRQARLAAWVGRVRPGGVDLSAPIAFDDWAELSALRAGARDDALEGLMLKRRDAPYVAGRPVGPWFKWKRDPLEADCVLMYAQRGHGKRSSYYSDYTFGAWVDGPEGRRLLPVGKAYSGFTDEELVRLDKWVRANFTERFGPVRGVRPGLVLEVVFDAVQASPRHKSGLAMRFPRIRRIRWDKPIEEAATVADIRALI
ncbi:DNA ligase-1 [Rubricella aquisinus]|uniref:DNA ligase (ATP) n=1 Tax=Rubricella aquisinus TaxID=2028108 RepID=A0A840WK92_9RHOB|nr:cisplatin damage response ATP-dependent DNA ligase [Rubricella aquisinus]MBB5515479.1 DNA ligase-1 [Rubricella aquisinus]